MLKQTLKTADLDVVGQNFGLLFDGDMAHLYVEDGDIGDWLFKLSFNPMYLGDLGHVAHGARAKISKQ